MTVILVNVNGRGQRVIGLVSSMPPEAVRPRYFRSEGDHIVGLLVISTFPEIRCLTCSPVSDEKIGTLAYPKKIATFCHHLRSLHL
jgi:hypothetical protein